MTPIEAYEVPLYQSRSISSRPLVIYWPNIIFTCCKSSNDTLIHNVLFAPRVPA